MRRNLALTGALAVIAAAAIPASAADALRVDAVTTGNSSELIQSIPVEASPGGWWRAMELEPEAMPALEIGDRLRVSAELALTTDCTKPLPRCTGRPYRFDPRYQTQVLLSSAAGEEALAKDAGRCVQQPGDRQHHCVLSYHGMEAAEAAERLSCADEGCSIAFLIRAHNPQAQGGERLILGGQDATGRIRQDRGRINALRIRPGWAALPDPTRAGPVRTSLAPDLRKRVIYSVKVPDLRQGEVLEAWVDARAEVDHLPYPAFVSSQIVLAESPNATHGKRFTSKVARLRGEFNEATGTNCTQAQTPCPVQRTGLLEIRSDSQTPSGGSVPLFVNVVAKANNKLMASRPGDEIRIRDAGGLAVRRYPGA